VSIPLPIFRIFVALVIVAAGGCQPGIPAREVQELNSSLYVGMSVERAKSAIGVTSNSPCQLSWLSDFDIAHGRNDNFIYHRPPQYPDEDVWLTFHYEPAVLEPDRLRLASWKLFPAAQ
jgi:hypothetical protein